MWFSLDLFEMFRHFWQTQRFTLYSHILLCLRKEALVTTSTVDAFASFASSRECRALLHHNASRFVLRKHNASLTRVLGHPTVPWKHLLPTSWRQPRPHRAPDHANLLPRCEAPLRWCVLIVRHTTPRLGWIPHCPPLADIFCHVPCKYVENLSLHTPSNQIRSSQLVNSTQAIRNPQGSIEGRHVKSKLSRCLPSRHDLRCCALSRRTSTRLARVFYSASRPSSFGVRRKGCSTSKGTQRRLERREEDEANDATRHQRLLCKALGKEPATRR